MSRTSRTRQPAAASDSRAHGSANRVGRVVLGVSASASGHAALRAAVAEAVVSGAELQLVRAWREAAPKKLLAAFEGPQAPIKKPRVSSRRARAAKPKPKKS